MEKKILVAYATHAGSTREIAEFIGKVLTEKGMEAEVQEMKSVKSAKEYGGIVLGAPMYIFHLLGDAHRFLKKYKKEIEKYTHSILLAWADHRKRGRLEKRAGTFRKGTCQIPLVSPGRERGLRRQAGFFQTGVSI